MSGSVKSALLFENARLRVRLGWGEEERARPQDVELYVRVAFATPPAACASDELADTVCYADLIERAEKLCQQRAFRLLEHLAAALAGELRQAVPEDADLTIRVTKLRPPIDALRGGVSFELRC